MPKTNSKQIHICLTIKYALVGLLFLLVIAQHGRLVATPLSSPGVNNCSKHDPMDLSVPLCPESGQILTSDYPAAAVTIAESFSIEGSYPKDHPMANAGYDRIGLLAKTIENIFRGQPGKPPQIFLNGRPETKKKLVEILSAKKLGTRQELERAISLTPDFVQGGSWTWQQDIMQDGFDALTGRPVLREIVPYHARGTRRHVRSTIATVRNQCGLVNAGGINGPGPRMSGHAGGNIEALPGGLCMVGNDSISVENRNEFYKSACGSLDSVVEIDTSLLSPGHVDEMVAVVPDRTAPEGCQFAILAASPLAALAAMQKSTEEPAFSFPGLTKAEIENRIRINDSWLRVCSNFKNHFHGTSPKNSKPARTTGAIETFRRFSFFEKAKAQQTERLDEGEIFKKDLLRLRRSLLKNDQFEKKLPPTYFRSDCAEMTNRQMFESFEKPELAREPIIHFNSDFHDVMLMNEARVLDSLKSKFPNCKPKVLRVPQLVFGQVVEFKGLPVSLPGSGAALNPAPTNGIVIGDKYVMPDPMNEAFRKHNLKLFESIGLKLEFLDTSSLSASFGNLHCATNVVRYCRPRGRK